jgi:glycosyltransferase involved in cell wall biosynthesis
LLLLVPTLSSYEAFLSDFAEAAHAEGYEVHVATRLSLLDGREVDECAHLTSGISFHPLSMPRGASPLSIIQVSRELRALVESLKPDWIQAHFSIAALVLALARQNKWPYTSSVIQGLASTLAKGFSRVLTWLAERYAISRLDEMWVLTKDDYAVISTWDATKARLQEAPGFGCRLGLFNSDSYDADWCRQRKETLSLSATAFTLIFVGRLVAFKGFDKVVRTYRELKSRGADVQLILLGTLDDLHSSGLSKCELEQLKADPSVLLGGWQKSVAEWMAIADLCVFPSVREGMPVCLMESIAMGVPVLTTDSRGCRDVVRDGVDGYTLPDASVMSLVEKVESLMEDSKTLGALGEACQSGRSRFDRNLFVTEQMVAMKDAIALN